MAQTLGPIVPEHRQVVSMGAEATIFIARYLDFQVIIKQRVAKPYRNKKIDNKLRKDRTIQEIRLLQQALSIGIPVPRVIDILKESWTIIMEKKSGKPIKKALEGIDEGTKELDKLAVIFSRIGEFVGKLHSIDIIHGDLTTSNILLDNEHNLSIIDFGLGYISPHVEDQAVDLLVLKHVLESSHPVVASDLFSAFMRSYKETNIDGQKVDKRMNVVEGRVRYRSHEF